MQYFSPDGSGGSGDGGSSGESGSGGYLSPELDIIPEDNDLQFSIGGSGNSVLTIHVFTPELNGSVVYCRDGMFGRDAANFTLLSTRKHTSNFFK